MKILRAPLLALAVAIAPSAAPAQSNPAWAYGFVPTAGQWNAEWSSKQDWLGAAPLLVTGGTLTGELVTAASSSVSAGLNLPPGAAPTTPANGDVWETSGGVFARVAGTTYNLATPSFVTLTSSVNFNAANTDTLIPVTLPPGFSRYRVDKVIIGGASTSLTTATFGVFTAAAGGGTAVVTGGSAITVSTASDNTNNNMQSATVNNALTESYNAATVATLYFRVGTAQGSTATGVVTITLAPIF